MSMASVGARSGVKTPWSMPTRLSAFRSLRARRAAACKASKADGDQPNSPPSRRALLKNTLQLLAAAGVAGISSEQVWTGSARRLPPPPLLSSIRSTCRVPLHAYSFSRALVLTPTTAGCRRCSHRRGRRGRRCQRRRAAAAGRSGGGRCDHRGRGPGLPQRRGGAPRGGRRRRTRRAGGGVSGGCTPPGGCAGRGGGAARGAAGAGGAAGQEGAGEGQGRQRWDEWWGWGASRPVCIRTCSNNSTVYCIHKLRRGRTCRRPLALPPRPSTLWQEVTAAQQQLAQGEAEAAALQRGKAVAEAAAAEAQAALAAAQAATAEAEAAAAAQNSNVEDYKKQLMEVGRCTACLTFAAAFRDDDTTQALRTQPRCSQSCCLPCTCCCHGFNWRRAIVARPLPCRPGAAPSRPRWMRVTGAWSGRSSSSRWVGWVAGGVGVGGWVGVVGGGVWWGGGGGAWEGGRGRRWGGADSWRAGGGPG